MIARRNITRIRHVNEAPRQIGEVLPISTVIEEVVDAPTILEVPLSEPGAKCGMARWHIAGSEMLVVQEQEIILRGKNKAAAWRCGMRADTVI